MQIRLMNINRLELVILTVTMNCLNPKKELLKKEGNKVYTGEELTNVVNLLKNSTFNNQNFTLANGQNAFLLVFRLNWRKKLGINMLVKLITPDGKVLEKVSGKVFGEGVGILQTLN